MSIKVQDHHFSHNMHRRANHLPDTLTEEDVEEWVICFIANGHFLPESRLLFDRHHLSKITNRNRAHKRLIEVKVMPPAAPLCCWTSSSATWKYGRSWWPPSVFFFFCKSIHFPITINISSSTRRRDGHFLIEMQMLRPRVVVVVWIIFAEKWAAFSRSSQEIMARNKNKLEWQSK